MVVNFARITGKLTRNQLEHSILRNFGGFDPDDVKFQPMEIFQKICPVFASLEPSDDDLPETEPIKLIQASLFGTENWLVSFLLNFWYCITKKIFLVQSVANETLLVSSQYVRWKLFQNYHVVQQNL